MPPFSYTVPGRFNIGFLKLSVATRPINSTAGTWPCLCRLETDGPHTLDGGESWGALTIPMIQRRSTFINKVVSKCPPTGNRSLSSMPFPSSLHYLDFLNQPYTAPLRHGAGHDKPASDFLYAFRFSFPSHFWARFRPSPCFSTLSPSCFPSGFWINIVHL